MRNRRGKGAKWSETVGGCKSLEPRASSWTYCMCQLYFNHSDLIIRLCWISKFELLAVHVFQKERNAFRG